MRPNGGFVPAVGVDYDIDDDGVLDASWDAAFVDAVGWVDDQDGAVDDGSGAQDRLYGGITSLTQGQGSPDAATRILGDVTPFADQAGWYNGDLDGAGFVPEQSSVVYDFSSGAVSDNAPLGALITLGAPNGLTNVAPRFDGPTLLTTDIGTPIALPIRFSDDGIGAGVTTVTLTATGGLVALAPTTAEVTGAGTGSVTVSGTAEEIDTALRGAVVTPEAASTEPVRVDLLGDDGILTRMATFVVNVRAGGLPAVQLDPLGGIVLDGGAEIVAYDPASERAVVVAGASVVTGEEVPSTVASIVDVSDPSALSLVGTIDLQAFGASLSSVDIRDGVAAIAVLAEPNTEPGTVVCVDLASANLLGSVVVGANPDMVTYTPDGARILVANEGEPNCFDTTYVDPEGSISVIDVPAGGLPAQGDVRTLDFRGFNNQRATLLSEGVRIFDIAASVAQDLEPEYIGVAPDGGSAFVALQENNAVAVLDLDTETVTDVVALGYKDHSLPGNGLDPSDQDGEIAIQPQPGLLSMFLPDTVFSYEDGGGAVRTIIANEGDAREYEDCIEEETRAADLDPSLDGLPLGRLNVTSEVPYVAGGPLYSFGARSFSVLDDEGERIFDSGDQIEQISARLAPHFFNTNNEGPVEVDTRSDAKGPEPEGVTVVEVDGRDLALVGLERQGGIMVFDVTDPLAPTFVEYETSTFDPNNVEGDRGPEGFETVASADSPTGAPLVLATYELSSSLRVFEVTGIGDGGPTPPEDPCASPTMTGTEGDDSIVGTPGDDVIAGLGGNDFIIGGRGNDTICGGVGNDTIDGRSGDDRLFGDGGADTLIGANDDDVVDGGNGADHLTGDAAATRFSAATARTGSRAAPATTPSSAARATTTCGAAPATTTSTAAPATTACSVRGATTRSPAMTAMIG